MESKSFERMAGNMTSHLRRLVPIETLVAHGHVSQIGSMIMPQVFWICPIIQEFCSIFQRKLPTKGHPQFDAFPGVVGQASSVSSIPSLSVSVIVVAMLAAASIVLVAATLVVEVEGVVVVLVLGEVVLEAMDDEGGIARENAAELGSD